MRRLSAWGEEEQTSLALPTFFLVRLYMPPSVPPANSGSSLHPVGLAQYTVGCNMQSFFSPDPPSQVVTWKGGKEGSLNDWLGLVFVLLSIRSYDVNETMGGSVSVVYMEQIFFF